MLIMMLVDLCWLTPQQQQFELYDLMNFSKEKYSLRLRPCFLFDWNSRNPMIFTVQFVLDVLALPESSGCEMYNSSISRGKKGGYNYPDFGAIKPSILPWVFGVQKVGNIR